MTEAGSAKPDTSRMFCPESECPDYSQFGKGNLRPRRQYGKQGHWMIKCTTCGGEFSERRGTVFFGLHAPVSYDLFDQSSIRVAEGAVAEQRLALDPEEVIECPLALEAAKEAGTYTVKLTAVTANSERVVELVDHGVR